MDDVGHYNRKILTGCGIIVLVVLLGGLALLGSSVNSERKRAQYPGSVSLTGHSNYSALPSQFRWDNSYRTTDSFPTVYQWYSTTFDPVNLLARWRAGGQSAHTTERMSTTSCPSTWASLLRT